MMRMMSNSITDAENAGFKSNTNTANLKGKNITWEVSTIDVLLVHVSPEVT